jgi:hypothetical protein
VTRGRVVRGGAGAEDRRCLETSEGTAPLRILFSALLGLSLLAGGALAQTAPWTGPKKGVRTAPLAAPATPQATPGQRQSCAAPLRAGCERMQASCRLACPPQWSTNPNAPAFTPNDRAGCTSQCMTRYLACMTQYGCY